MYGGAELQGGHPDTQMGFFFFFDAPAPLLSCCMAPAKMFVFRLIVVGSKLVAEVSSFSVFH